AQGEEWHKIYGPFLIYCNKVPQSTVNPQMALWQDAIRQSKAEQAQWPYDWFTEPGYVKANGRGKISGKLVINDPMPFNKAYNMWIGVAIPPASLRGIKNFEMWSKNYQFWVKTDAKGNFTIPNVLPGVYDMYAFGSGVAGQMTKHAFVTVKAGETTNLGKIEWTPERVAPTVWEIGIPDRTAKEFKHGKDWWVGGVYPDLHWAKFMDYNREFPNGVNFVIGKSDWSKDWNFVQPYNVVGTEQTTPPVWKILFKLTSAPTAGSNSSLYLAAAASTRAALVVTVNGTNILPQSDTTRISFPNPSGATIRKGIHGAFGDLRLTFPSSLLHAGNNEIALILKRPGGDVVYDYLRLESPGTQVTKP
ncbi:MAG: polysaccharide lyase family protein, partial [Bacteroidota bacterium]|nr:polysaccharide lyase family protein [Bacteroidota bacterium]